MTTLETPGGLLTVSETMQILRVSRSTLYRLVARGELPALKVGNGLRFDRNELHHWLYESERHAPR